MMLPILALEFEEQACYTFATLIDQLMSFQDSAFTLQENTIKDVDFLVLSGFSRNTDKEALPADSLSLVTCRGEMPIPPKAFSGPLKMTWSSDGSQVKSRLLP